MKTKDIIYMVFLQIQSGDIKSTCTYVDGAQSSWVGAGRYAEEDLLVQWRVAV